MVPEKDYVNYIVRKLRRGTIAFGPSQSTLLTKQNRLLWLRLKLRLMAVPLLLTAFCSQMPNKLAKNCFLVPGSLPASLVPSSRPAVDLLLACSCYTSIAWYNTRYIATNSLLK